MTLLLRNFHGVPSQLELHPGGGFPAIIKDLGLVIRRSSAVIGGGCQ